MYVHVCTYSIMSTQSVQQKVNDKEHTEFIKQIMKVELKKYNPTLKNILKIEQIMAKHKEFDTKKQLVDKLDVSMRPPVLNVILKYLEKSNKILLNNDGSITWIYASSKAVKNWNKAVKL